MSYRPKYSQKLAEEIAALVEGGRHTINEICSLSGISRKSFYKWKRERLQFTDLLTRAEEKNLSSIVSEAKRSLLKLIRGSEGITTTSRTWRLKNGTLKSITTTQTYHIPPDLEAILFVLTNRDPKNFAASLHRTLTAKNKRGRKFEGSNPYRGIYKYCK